MSENITLYSTQSNIVLETLKNEGVYYVKMEYVDKKYNEVSKIFKTAYTFFNEHASKILPKPVEAESAIWGFSDSMWAVPHSDSSLLTLSIPKSEVIAFDQRIFSKILNLEFVGDEKETLAFNEKLKKYGVKDTLEIFNTSFHPLLKREILKSWEKLFEQKEFESKYIQYGFWKLLPEYIINIK